MKTYTEEELQKILADHKEWLSGESGKFANLSHAYLRRADLSNANLSRAYLWRADLSHANLSHADLSHANLSVANLSDANLTHANLSGANFNGADLSGANLSGANLIGAKLTYAKLFNVKCSNTLIFGKPVNKAPVQLYDLPYYVLITDTMMKIGCQVYSIDEWLAFTVEKIENMDGDAKKFYDKYGDLVKAAILSHRIPKEENKES